MGEIFNALDGMKTVFLNANPSPQDSLADAWVFPDERDDIDFSTLPVAIISRLVNQEEVWWRRAIDLSRHDWTIEALLFLKIGPILNDEQGALAELLCDPWMRSITSALYESPTLYGNIIGIGEPNGRFYRAQIGQIDWMTKVFWGIRFLFQVGQSVSH